MLKLFFSGLKLGVFEVMNHDVFVLVPKLGANERKTFIKKSSKLKFSVHTIFLYTTI
jgi:hypothetical protein